MKGLLLVLLITVAIEYAVTKTCHKLTANDDRSKFSTSTSPQTSEETFKRMLYGNGWADWRKKGEEGPKVHSYKGGFDKDLTINVAMADGSGFKLRKLHFKAIHSEDSEYIGHKADGSVVNFTKEKILDQKRFPKWKKIVVKSGGIKDTIQKLEIKIKLHEHDHAESSDNKKDHKLYVRGLKVKVCQ